MKKYLSLVLAACLVSGCGFTKYYPGPRLEDREIARIYYHFPIKLLRIDGSNAFLANDLQIHFLPGRHAIVLYYNVPLLGTGKSCTLEFDAEAGREYQILYEVTRPTWRAFLRKYANGYSAAEKKEPFSPDRDIPCKFSKD